MNKMVAVGHVDVRDRPKSRPVDHFALIVDQSDAVGLRQVRQSSGQQAVGLFGPHQQLELLRVGDRLGGDLCLYFLQDKIDCLHRACRLLGESDPEIAHLSPVAGHRFFAAMPGGEAGRDHDHRDKHDAGDREASAGRRGALWHREEIQSEKPEEGVLAHDGYSKMVKASSTSL